MRDDPYSRLAGAFADKHGLTSDDVESQWDVVEEEIEELEEAYEMWSLFLETDGAYKPDPGAERDLAEEMADVLFTVHLLARMIGIDLRSEYVQKSLYNLEKSPDRDGNGKITDDAEV